MIDAIANFIGRQQGGITGLGVADAFMARVIADGGVFEAESCTASILQNIIDKGVYERASLIVTPNGYKESKLYSSKPTNGIGDFAYTRAGTSTRKGASLVEQVPYNLLARSEAFDNAYWSKSLTTITANQSTDIIGGNTVDLVTENAGSGTHRVSAASGLTLEIGTYTSTVHLKAGTRRYLIFRLGNGSHAFGVVVDTQNWIIANTGVIGSATYLSSSLIADANSNYKLVVTGSFSIGALVSAWVVDGSDVSTWTASGTSAGSGTWYMWGARLVIGSSESDYFTTTDRFNVPKLDYTGSSCPRILLEPSRTNLLIRSEEFDNASWAKIDTTITPNSIVAPNGTSTADLFTEGVAGTAQTQQSVTTTADVNYVISHFIKRGNHDWIAMRLSNGANRITGYFNLATGQKGSVTNEGTATGGVSYIEDYGNGWYRCILSGAINNAVVTVNSFTCSATADNNPNPINNATRYQWGAQFENNVVYHTSYIPTTTATVTRIVDAVTNLTGISALIGQTEGTLYADLRSWADGTDKTLSISDGTNSNSVFLQLTAGNQIRLRVQTGAVQQASLQTPFVSFTNYKIVVLYANNRAALFVNGIKIGEDLTVTVPVCTRISFNDGNGANSGPFYGFIKTFMIIPIALTDVEAINLTT